jgi:hypothetical protein
VPTPKDHFYADPGESAFWCQDEAGQAWDDYVTFQRGIGRDGATNVEIYQRGESAACVHLSDVQLLALHAWLGRELSVEGVGERLLALAEEARAAREALGMVRYALRTAREHLRVVKLLDDKLDDAANDGAEARAPDGDDYNAAFNRAMAALAMLDNVPDATEGV